MKFSLFILVIEQILSSSIKSSGRKDPRQQSALIKHRSEADIFASLKESKSLQQNNFISEIREHLCSQPGWFPVQNSVPMVRFPCKSEFCILSIVE